MDGRDMNRGCALNTLYTGVRSRSRVILLGAVGSLLAALGLRAAPGAGFDEALVPPRPSRPQVRQPLRTADVSVLTPPSIPGVAPTQEFEPTPALPTADPWAEEGSWDPSGVGAAPLEGFAGTTVGDGEFDGGVVGCDDVGDCHHSAGLFQRLCGDAWPRWTVQVDALMLWRGNIASRPLLSRYDPVTTVIGPTALNANQAQPAMTAGPRVGLIYSLSQVHAIEGNYFQARPFAGQATTGPGSFVENNLAGFSFPVDTTTVLDSSTLFTRASIQSAELNWRRRTAWRPITWLAGFRWVEWDEQMRIDQTALAGGYGSLFRTDTINNLYGGQLGIDLGLWTGSRFNVNGVGKAGVFLNRAGQASSFQDSFGYSDAMRAQADGTAFFGEIGVNGSLQLTQWLAWRVGYAAFWLSGVATPANQLAVTNLNPLNPAPPGGLNTNGSVLLQGVTTGLEARW